MQFGLNTRTRNTVSAILICTVLVLFGVFASIHHPQNDAASASCDNYRNKSKAILTPETSPLEETDLNTAFGLMKHWTRSEQNTCIYVYGLSTERFDAFESYARDANMGSYVKLRALVGQKDIDYTVRCMGKQAEGYKGMWASIFHILVRSYFECTRDWVLIFENDAVFSKSEWSMVTSYLSTVSKQKKIIWFDARRPAKDGPSECCTTLVAYRRSALFDFIPHFSYNNETRNFVQKKLKIYTIPHWEQYENKGRWQCLTDLYMHAFCVHLQIPAASKPLIRHRSGNSEIGAVQRAARQDSATSSSSV